MRTIVLGCALALACVLSTAVVAQLPGMPLPPGLGETKGVTPEADNLLKQMCTYVGGLKQFSVQTESSFDVVLKSGQKVQFCTDGDLYVKRPNKLRADRKGQFADLAFYYDGQNMTVHGKRMNYYASTAAPPTLDEAIDMARDDYGLIAPAADLFYTDAYDGLKKQADSGFVVGKNDINGVMCNHLAFRGKTADWQVWIQDGPTPLPIRYVITGPASAGAPQFEVTMRSWDLNPTISDADFTFVPPKGAQKIEFLKRGQPIPSGKGGK